MNENTFVLVKRTMRIPYHVYIQK